jgi:hypothetical protein
VSAVSSEQAELRPWKPAAVLDGVTTEQVQYSRGFMRCEMGRLLANLSALWLPLFHAAGAELRVRKISQFVGDLPSSPWRFTGTIDGEAISIALDQVSADQLIRAFTPGAGESAGKVLIEYLARRLFSSLNMAWTGPEMAQISFNPTLSQSVNVKGGVKLELLVQSVPVVILVGIGAEVLSQLDVVWRKQLRTAARSDDSETSTAVVLAQLAVPPLSIVDYTKAGAIIDLEVPESREAVLWRSGRAAATVRICQCEGRFAFEVTDLAPQSVAIPSGTTRLKVELWSGKQNESTWSELSQIGAMFSVQAPMSSSVRLVVNEETVATGELCSYQGRFAVKVKGS